MIPNKDTLKFFSVSSKPGNFGALLYNTAFEALKLNAIYLPLKCEKNEFANFYKSITLIANGLSVSMPFKKEAFYLSHILDDVVKDVASVNTIIIAKTNIGFGYNTDYSGFLAACSEELQKNQIQNVAIYGTGCVASTIKKALASLKIKSDLIPRKDDYFIINKQKQYDGLINATPIGMDGIEDVIFDSSIVKNYKFVFDVVVKKETNLIQVAKSLNIPCVNGVSMSLEQLCNQFKIYMSSIIQPPRDIFIKTLKENNYI